MPIIEFDQWGNPSFVSSIPVQNTYRTATIVPPAALKSYWTATIGASIVSPRCTTCHALDTEAKISFQHSGTSPAPVQVPSVLVQGKSVLHCGNCHETEFAYLGESSSFIEGKWATPTPELDIDWAQIINDHPNSWPSEICSRMTLNMPTHAIREKHFHEDARLFWAVAKGELPVYGQTKPTAAPHNYADFIDRFDIWNDSGAACP